MDDDAGTLTDEEIETVWAADDAGAQARVDDPNDTGDDTGDDSGDPADTSDTGDDTGDDSGDTADVRDD